MTRASVSRQEIRARVRARWIVVGVLGLALVFVAGTFLAPAMMDAGNPWGGLLRLSYAPLCHQQPARSLEVGGGFQAVCARCSGLYLGGLAGLVAGAAVLVGRRVRMRPVWLAVVALPTFLDAVVNAVGLPALTNLPRMLLALPVGFVAALFLARGIEEILCSREARPGPGRTPGDEQQLNTASRRVGRESLEAVDG